MSVLPTLPFCIIRYIMRIRCGLSVRKRYYTNSDNFQCLICDGYMPPSTSLNSVYPEIGHHDNYKGALCRVGHDYNSRKILLYFYNHKELQKYINHEWSLIKKVK